MTELERRLVALRDDVEWPATPEMAAALTARLEAAGEQRRGPTATPRRCRPWAAWPRPLAVAAAILVAVVVAGTAVLAVSPDVRADVLRWLGIGGVRIEVVRELPPTSAGADLRLGRRVTAAEARVAARRSVPRAAALGEPDALFLAERPPGAVTAVWGGRRPDALLTVFRGDGLAFIKKLVAGDTPPRAVRVDGAPGVWLGAAHSVLALDRDGRPVELLARLAAPTLLWVRDGLTYRLEADVPLARALHIGRSVG
jgi:hypothetical protein